MKYKILALLVLSVMVIGAIGSQPSIPLSLQTHTANEVSETLRPIPNDLLPMVENAVAEDNPYLPADYDIGSVLGDRDNLYKVNYEPWKSKAAIHAVEFHEETGLLALGGGYLYDNEIHIFRLNTETNEFDKVWDSGDGVFQSDVMSIAFGDTDLNDFIEIAAGCSDGKVYVFEQRHLYDPYANTENQFDLVWTSPSMFRVFDLEIEDIDRDYRPDIIAGGWDGKVHIFEYDNHSGYPFVEEHWITYDEVATLDAGGRIYSVEAGDTNANGLPEVIVGTREGRIYVYENDGITLWVNGQPFPLIYDNHYYLNWTSENYTWSPILSMDIGELDGSPGDELAIVAQGQGVLTLDWNSDTKTYDYNKVYRPYKEWETFGLWGLDYWADSVVEANNVTYHDPLNGSISEPEPIEYVWGGSYFIPDASVYPYNTGMATYTDGNYSTFDSSIPGVDNATAIVDFGKDEEGTGSANDEPDVIITFRNPLTADVFTHLNFSISQDGQAFEQVMADHFSYSGKELKIDVDTALSRKRWDWFQYAKISVFDDASYDINSLELMQVYNLLTDALSVAIGPLKEDGNLWKTGGEEENKIIVGTVIGELMGIKYNTSTTVYDLFWESGDDDYYTYGANIWDLEYVGTPTNLPNWNLYVQGAFPPETGYVANSWGYGIPDPNGDKTWHAFMAQNLEEGGDTSIRAFNSNFQYDSTTQSLLVEINNDIAPVNFGFEYASVENPWILNNYGSQVSMMVVGGLDEDVSLDSTYSSDEDLPNYYRGNILFYYRDSALDPWNDYLQLWQIDTDGQLTDLVNLATATPRTDFADYDGDGDFDFVVSNGRLYMAENVQEESGKFNVTLVQNYFKDINDIQTSKIWGQPDLHDLDDDGDLDLVLSYDGRNGATAFINEGTREDPIWVEHKKLMSNTGEFTNLNLLNQTNIRMLPDYGGFYGGPFLERYFEFAGLEKPDYFMYSFNSYYDNIWMSTAERGAADAYIVASYPTVSRLQINVMDGDVGKFFNLGFHVMEDWNNEFDLEDWTLAITSADTDSDGNNEIIVGDYDNNVYAFEHLVNNTYKRMFRSFDLNHSETSDTSPYAYEDLEGISGDFNRRIWDHAEHLVADVDLDQDGLKEIIVGADLQFYIFEEEGLYGGDSVRYVYSVDLRDTEWGDRPNFQNYANKITAMAAGDDIDQDGRKELAVAAGPYLFVYNINEESFVDMEDNEFYVTSVVMEGRYYLPGNGENSNFRYHQINAMTMCDTDQDGYREIIIGGIEDTRLIRQNGFVYIYESAGGTFQKSWSAPTEVTEWNPVTVLTLDDQDYDGETEIIIGHSQGFDMWEHIPGEDNGYQKVEYVTASPNYPIMPVRTTFQGADSYGLSGRSIKDVEFFESGGAEGWAIMVYEAAGVTPHEIHYKVYYPSIDTWSGYVNLRDQITYNGNTSNVESEFNPSVATTTDGDYYISWEVYDTSGTHYLAIVWGEVGVGYHTAQLYPETTGLWWVDRFNPSVFEYNSSHMGMMYTYSASLAISDIGCLVIKKDTTGGFSGVPLNFNNYYRFRTHDIDAVRLVDGRIAVALSAKYLDNYKPDHDIWVAVSKADFNWTGVSAHQATSSYSEEMFVKIDYMRTSDQSLVVMYESLGDVLEDKFMMVASQDDGATWSIPEPVNTLPDSVVRTELPGGLVTYNVIQPSSFSPAFCGRPDAGFLYVFSFAQVAHILIGDQGWVRLPFTDIVYGKNLQSDWALNHLRDVVDLDVGDTDGDSRREVVVGFGHQVAVYEMHSSNNGTGFMYYLEDWLSDEYDNPVTGVTVSDSNGNGWDEIALSSERGDVYFLEYLDVSEGFTPLKGSVVNWTAQPSGYGQFGGAATFGSFDFDNDTREEVITVSYTNARVAAFDDDGTSLWNNTDASSGFRMMKLIDINNDTIPEVLLAGRDDVFRVLDITNGSEVWNYAPSSNDIMSIAVADADADGGVEIAVGTQADEVWMFHSNGTLYYNWTIGSGDIHKMTFGNFTASDHLDLAMTTSTRITVVNPFNGTILYQSPSSTAGAGPRLNAADLNEDGADDLIFGKYGLHILDVLEGEWFYNSTIYQTSTFLLDIWMEDFDGDGGLELLTYNVNAEVFMVDVTSGATQWQYKPTYENYFSYDADIGQFGGSGEYDLVLGLGNSSNDGVLLAIDGKNGVPMWFNQTGDVPYTVAAADIHGTGTDTAFSWDLVSYEIKGVDTYERVIPEDDYAFFAHPLYYDTTIENITIYGIQVADFNSDNLDEIIAWDNNNSLYLLNGTNGALLWNIMLDGIPQKVEVGNLDGSGWLDIVLYDDNDDFYFLSGNDGSQITSVIHPTGFFPQDFFVENFNDGLSNDEIAILWQDASEVFIAWYNHDGTIHYKSSSNVTAQVAHMAVGDFTGDGLADVIIGGTNEASLIYRGTDGVFQQIIGTGGPSVYDLVVGNFTGDQYADFMWLDSSYDPHVVDGSSFAELYEIVTPTLTLDIAAGDVDSDGKDELVVYTERDGVFAYDESGTEEWAFVAQLLLNTFDSSMSVADMNGDAYADILFVNHEYLAVVSGQTAELLWHHVTPGYRINNPLVGQFIDPSYPPDVASYWGDEIYVISGIATPPSPPASPTPPGISPNVWTTERITAAALVVFPIIGCIAIISIVIKKKEEEQ